jgi:hypothetical protein
MKIIPSRFELKLHKQPMAGECAGTVAVTVHDVGGEKHTLFIPGGAAEELGWELLAGALALNGELRNSRLVIASEK